MASHDGLVAVVSELPGLPVAPDADVVRRLALAWEEITELNAVREMHNGLINTLHRDLHDAAKLIGDVHVAGTLDAALRARCEAHVARHGHPQDVPESEPQ